MKTAIITDQVSEDFEQACRTIKQNGFTYIDIHNVKDHSIEECTDEEVKWLKQTAEKYGLKIANLATTLFFLCPLHDGDRVSLFNESFHCFHGNKEAHLKQLDRAIEIARELDCPTLRLFPFRYPDNRTGIAGTEQDIHDITEIMKAAAKKAEQADILLVLENCPYSHLPKGKMTKEIIDRVQSPHLKLLWDPANSYRAEKHQVPEKYLRDTLQQEKEAIKNDIGHIHLKNYEYIETEKKPFVHRALLEGDIDYRNLLKDMETDAVFSLEPEVDEAGTERSMKQIGELL